MLTHSPISGDSGTSGPQAAPGPLGQSESPWAWPRWRWLQWAPWGADPPWPPASLPQPIGQTPRLPGELARASLTLSSAAAAAGPRVDRAVWECPGQRVPHPPSHPPIPACSASSREGGEGNAQSTVCPLPTLRLPDATLVVGQAQPGCSPSGGSGPPAPGHEAITAWGLWKGAQAHCLPAETGPQPRSTPVATGSSLTVEDVPPAAEGTCRPICPAGPTPASAFQEYMGMAAWGGWWLKVSEVRSGWQCPQQLEVTAQVRVAHLPPPQTQSRAQGPGPRPGCEGSGHVSPV